MTDSTISQQVTQWKTRLNTITSNLLDLYGAESTKIIRARLKDPVHGYSGVTQARAARAIELLDALLDLYTRLEHVIDEASDLVGKGGMLRDKEQRVKELLDGQSIVLQTQHIVVSNRGLLDGEEREVRATPSEALAHMEQSFAEARDAITAIVDAVTHVQPQLAALGQEITTLEHWAKTLGTTRPTVVADTSLAMARVERDPLGCAPEVDQMAAAVARWRTELQALVADHQAILASLARGKAALAELRDLIARSRAAFAEAREKIADPAGLVPPTGDDVVEPLDAWLRTLEQHAAAGRFAAVKVGMAKWERNCSDLLDAERASYARNSAGLDERAELRGRFKALCAKADTLRNRGLALGDAVEAASRQAKSVLDAIPCDIRAGRRCVEAFAVALSAAGK